MSCAQSGELKNTNLNTKDSFSAQTVPSQLSFSSSCPSNVAAAPGSKAAMSAEARRDLFLLSESLQSSIILTSTENLASLKILLQT